GAVGQVDVQDLAHVAVWHASLRCGVAQDTAESTFFWKCAIRCSLFSRKRPWSGKPAPRPRWTESVRWSSSAPTWALNAIISSAHSFVTAGPKYASEKPRVRPAPSGIQTSTARLGLPGLMLMVKLGQR